MVFLLGSGERLITAEVPRRTPIHSRFIKFRVRGFGVWRLGGISSSKAPAFRILRGTLKASQWPPALYCLVSGLRAFLPQVGFPLPLNPKP